MPLPVLTLSLAQRFHEVQNALRIAAMTQLQQQAGNPYGITLQPFGHATAFRTASVQDLDAFNRIIGLQTTDLSLLDAIVAFFDLHHLPCYVDLGAWHLTPELGQTLTQRGWAPVICDTVLYGQPSAHPEEIPAGVEIHSLQASDLAFFTALWADGFAVPHDSQRAILKTLRGAHFAVPGNQLYLALVDSRPAAIAALYISNRIGYLNVGATLPAFRGRGCHTALTTKRIVDAARAGCEWVIGLVSPFGGISQQHFQRAGLQLAYNTLTLVRHTPAARA